MNSTGERIYKSKSNEELSHTYSLSSVNLPSNQVKSLSNIGVSVTKHLLSSSFVSSPPLTSADLQQLSTAFRTSYPVITSSSLRHQVTSKADESILTELSTLFANCSIKEPKTTDNKSALSDHYRHHSRIDLSRIYVNFER